MKLTTEQLETILENYLACALWSSICEDGEPLDDNYGIDDCADHLKVESADDIEAFCDSPLVDEYLESNSLEQLGHDFWLTRNRHGAGFWDRGLGELGKQLTDLARSYGSVDLYVNGDDMVDC